MKKVYVIGIIVLLVGVNVSGSFVKETKDVSAVSFDGNIFYVGGSGANNYTRIQDAIDNASDGDTVYVFNGTYYENNIMINESINLLGENQQGTIIDGNNENGTIENGTIIVISSGVSIQNFTFQNCGSKPYYPLSSIELRSNNNHISNNILIINESEHYDMTGGIALTNASYNNISHNIIHGAERGGTGICTLSSDHLPSFWSSNNIVSYNECYSAAIVLTGSGNLITKNYLSDPPGKRPSAIHLTGSPGLNKWATNNTISLNTVIMNNRSAPGEGIIMRGCKHNNISTNTIIGSGAMNPGGTNGIFMQYCYNNSIFNNNISNCMFGLNIQYTYWGITNSTMPIRNEDEQNTVLNNNFIKNLFPAGVLFESYLRTIWSQNYWNRPRILPKLIIALLYTGAFPIPARLELDLKPAKEPYDIPRVAI